MKVQKRVGVKMDFKRIETIFLVAFLSLNLFLGYTLFQGREAAVAANEDTLSYNLEKKFKEDSISYDKKISKDQGEGYYLSAVQTSLYAHEQNELRGQSYYQEGPILKSTFQAANQVVTQKNNADQTFREILDNKHQVTFGIEYFPSTATGNKFLYSQVWEGIPFIDETAQLFFDTKENGEELIVTGYEQAHLESIEALREKQDLISEYDALRTLYLNNKIPTDSTIVSRELGYTRIFTVRGKNVYIPAWFVTIETSKKNQQVERVNAFTNAILSSGVSEVKN